MADNPKPEISGLTLDIEEALKFFDEKPKDSNGHATSLVSVFGEDLGIQLLQHYCKGKNYGFQFINYRCTTGKQQGSRLDAWLSIDFGENKIFFQTEIKNWSAHALGGVRIPIDATEEVLVEFRKKQFRREFSPDNRIKKGQASKVLVSMKHPQDFGNNATLPLLCYWRLMHPEGKEEPFFQWSVNKEQVSEMNDGNAEFDKIYIFSMSAYLRLLLKQGVREIPIAPERTMVRLDWIRKILGK